jgi:hypothetical protein
LKSENILFYLRLSVHTIGAEIGFRIVAEGA